jgi:putative membrane protein
VKYKEAGWIWLEDDRMLIMRTRLVERTTVYIPRNRIQFLACSESPFQRKSELSTLTATVASNGVAGSRFKMKHIAKVDSKRTLSRLKL